MMPVFSVNMKCVFKVYFPFVFIQVFSFVIPAHLFVLLYKEAVLVMSRNPFSMKADIYEGFRCVSMHKMSVEFENDCGLFIFSS